MAAALLNKEENTVLIFAERILSELLDNASLISLHVLQMFFLYHLHKETAEEIATCV